MKTRAVCLLTASVVSLACGPKSDSGTAAAPAALKLALLHACLGPLAKENDPVGLVAMGVADQARGDLEAAEKKYRIAAGKGVDLLAASLDLTVADDVLWVQTRKCPVAIPDEPASEAATVEKLASRIDPVYPRVLLSVRTDASVVSTLWIGADGRASRIHVESAHVGPVGVSKRRDPGEELAERMVARVQFALQSIEELRRHDFGTALAGKKFEWKLTFVPPKDQSDALPGSK